MNTPELHPNEKIKDIKGFEGLYAITADGRVWSYPKSYNLHPKSQRHHGKYLNQGLSRGYYIVSLAKNGKKRSFRVNRLVALAHIDNPNGYPCVNHLDGIKTNNNSTNLEWCTAKQNVQHCINLNGKGYCGGQMKLNDCQQREVTEKYSSGNYTQAELGIEYSVKQSTIWYLINVIKQQELF